LFRVAVEAGNGAESTSNSCTGTAAGFEIPGEALDVGSADLEQSQVVLVAPGDELAQVERVGVASQVPVAGEERRQGLPLGVGEHRVNDSNIGRRQGHVAPPGRAETRRQEPPGPSYM
jgi:hypothetical protein